MFGRQFRSISDFQQQNIPIEDMFNLATKNNQTWGIQGYEAQKKYLDPVMQIKQREYLAQKKGQKNRNYVTKRGHYLDDLGKITGIVPAPNKYQISDKWITSKESSKKLSTPPPKRMTFVEEIIKEEKLRGVPGTGKYNVIKPLEEVKKDLEELKKKKNRFDERPCYLNDPQYLSNIYPGPGNYNPHVDKLQLNYFQDQVLKEKINTTTPSQMIEKHKNELKKRGVSAFPDVGTYKPYPADFDTFGKLLFYQEEKRQILQRKIFGSEERFKDPKKTKIINKWSIPGPGQYGLMLSWQGKEEGLKKQSKKQYLDYIATAPKKSIYY